MLPIFANGAATAAFSAIASEVGASQNSAPADGSGNGNGVGQCGETGKCHPGDFTSEEKAAIQAKIDKLSVDVKAGEYGSMEGALDALHDSGLYDYAQELGLELYANIDGSTYEVYNVSTGFDKGFAIGSRTALRASGDIIRHTHPSKGRIHAGDLRSITDHVGKKASWIFATGGKTLSGFQNPNYVNPANVTNKSYSHFSNMRFKTGFKERIDGRWRTGRGTL